MVVGMQLLGLKRAIKYKYRSLLMFLEDRAKPVRSVFEITTFLTYMYTIFQGF